MRFAAGLFAVALFGSVAMAEQAKPADPAAASASTDAKPAAKLGLRVVRVMPESKQALLFDKNRGTHVLVDEGGEISGYKVVEIDDDSVTLDRDGSEVVLAAPYRRGGGGAGRGDAPDAPAVKKQKANAPEDPYADAGDKTGDKTNAKAPEDPYGDAPVRTVEAPKDVKPGDDGVRVAEAPGAPKAPPPADPATTNPYDPPAAPPATTTPPVTTTPPATTPAVSTTGDLVLTKATFRAELSDFTKLSAGVKAAFIPTGVRLDSVTAGSLFARAGLRANDVVTAVNGQHLLTIDDAAELYARASSAKAIAIDIHRGGKSMTLHVTIQ